MISGPAYANTDASLLKDFTLPKTFKLQFRMESFNTFNQVNFANPNSTVTSGGFGQIQSTVSQTGRQLQFALKLYGRYSDGIRLCIFEPGAELNRRQSTDMHIE